MQQAAAEADLELTWLQDDGLDLSFLRDIREISGHLLVSMVDVPRVVLPSLRIIRGRTLFEMGVQDEQFAGIVTLSKMGSLEMPALRGETMMVTQTAVSFRFNFGTYNDSRLITTFLSGHYSRKM